MLWQTGQFSRKRHSPHPHVGKQHPRGPMADRGCRAPRGHWALGAPGLVGRSGARHLPSGPGNCQSLHPGGLPGGRAISYRLSEGSSDTDPGIRKVGAMIYLEGEPRNTGMGGRIPFQAHPLGGSWGAVPLGRDSGPGERSAHSGPFWKGCSLACLPPRRERQVRSFRGSPRAAAGSGRKAAGTL